MSEPKLISPVLDGFALGDPISEHHGVRCCPAIKEISEEKYIVKIVTVPAAQAQFDAFLLTGAYRDPMDAMHYFHSVAEDIVKEAQFLKDLSRLDGFLSYENWQIAEITRRRHGYEVYLLGPYKLSLEKSVRTEPMTHLGAMNLALDICNACNICRQAGALYVDLKPGNIFLTEKNQFRIGDLGFVWLDALAYTALPEKYQSRYTPPELLDPMASIDLTADTYALGMILYQLYNEGNLPQQNPDGKEPVSAPVNADYELADIILKAIHQDPKERWQDPGQMAQAIVAYMQRNAVNDDPITPYLPIDVDAQDVRLPREEPEEPVMPVVEPVSEKVSDSQEAVPEEPLVSAESPLPESSIEASAVLEEPPSEEETISQEGAPEETPAPEHGEEMPSQEDAQPIVAPLPEAEPIQESTDSPQPPVQLSQELSKIIAKADDLIAHETPVGVVLPEIPDPPDPFAFATEDSIEAAERNVPLDPVMEDVPAQSSRLEKKAGKFRSPAARQKMTRFLGNMVGVAALAGVCFAGFWGYQNLYLQSIDALEVSGSQDWIAVQIQSQAKESLLQVSCADSYGNVTVSKVVDGKASFSGLQSNTTYSISVDIDGFHALVGKTSDLFTTEATTSILSLSAVTGSEDGSVILNFGVQGEEPRKWILRYGIQGEDVETLPFEGHTVTVDGLTLGKVYDFSLDTPESLSLSGTRTISVLASRVILAENLTVTTENGRDLTVHWTTPGDTVVETWNVRYYNEAGDAQTLTVSDTQVTLQDMDPSHSYTVEVTAAGMTQPARVNITADPICITALEVDNSSATELKLQWEYTGKEPEGGWLLLYRMDGNRNQNVVKCSSASAVVKPQFPGVDYEFTIQAVDGTSVFDSVHTYACPEGPAYDANLLTQADVTAHLVKTPDDPDWTYDKLGADAFQETFAPGDPISIVLIGAVDFYLPGSQVDVHYVIRDAYGNVIPEASSETRISWSSIWNSGDWHYGELNLPKVPQASGSYQLSIYVDGAMLAQAEFTIS